MKQLSIRAKITLWFSIILIFIVGLTFLCIFSIGGSVLQKNLRSQLIETIEDNVDEIEYYDDFEEISLSGEDHYIEYGWGFLEIDDDFLDEVNGIYTSLYDASGMLLYGENPIAADTMGQQFVDGNVQTVRASSTGERYYIYDRMLTGEGVSGLWLRGVVSEREGEAQISAVVKWSLLLLPLLLLLSVGGGYWIAGRSLRPLQQIQQAALAIEQGSDLKKRIALGPGNDELHQLADTFNGMFGRLEQAFEAEQQFTADASHELRTPMAVIMAQCEFSLEDAETVEEYREALEVIQRQGKKMSQLIEDLLAFTRLEQAEERFPKERVDFSAWVGRVCEDMALLKEQDITLTAEVDQDVVLWGNESLLSRLLTNLISNAYRYGKVGGNIRVQLQIMAEDVMLTVADDGIGMTQEQQQKIFQRFYQADASRSGRGSGLGLAMVIEIVRFHGGAIQVESILGEGSKFLVRLPRVIPAEQDRNEWSQG